ncbi:tetratricopeptide repeat protein [Cupriavidus neocaledonicus]
MARSAAVATGRMRTSAACLLLAALCGCAGGNNGASAMHEQAEAQVELARLRDKAARAEYSEQAVYLGLIRKMQQDGLYFASLAHIEVYVQRFGAGPEIQVMRADALRETGQDQAAIEAYQRLLATAKGAEAAHAHHGLGLLAGRQDDFARAVTALRAASALDPVNARIASDLGYALMRAGALQDARVPVMQALELDARNPRVISNAVVWLMADGKRAQANAMMQKAALPEPTRSAIRKEADRIARAAARQGQSRPTSAPAAVAVVAKPIAIAAQAGATP